MPDDGARGCIADDARAPAVEAAQAADPYDHREDDDFTKPAMKSLKSTMPSTS